MIRTRFTVCAALVVLWAVAAPIALAQETPPPSSRPALPTDAELRLKQAIQGTFRVLPVQGGIILVPLSRRAGVDNVELRDGAIAVNGTVMTGAELRERLGRDADHIIELSYLGLETQRRLLLPPANREAVQGEGPPAPDAEPPPPTDEPAEAETARRPQREYRQVSASRVRVGGSISVAEDERVSGAVVAVGGDVEVNGRVQDAVVAVGGDVRLGAHADVDGDVTTVGGTVVRHPDAIVRGEVNEVSFRLPDIRFRPVWPWGVHVDPWWGTGPWRSVQLFGTLFRMGLFGLFAALVLLVAPRAVERVDATVRFEPWKAALVGFFAQLAFVPLLVVTVVFLAISIVGIPLLLLVPFVILLFVVALFLGFAGTASAVARGGRDRYGWASPGPFTLLVVGLLLIWGITVVGRVLSLPGGPLSFAGGLLLVLGFLVEYAAWTVGLGGAILTRFGRAGRLYPPPIPPTPAAEPDVL
jgi:hypothetical protein